MIGEVAMPQLAQLNKKGSFVSPLKSLKPSTTQELLLVEIYKVLCEIKELLRDKDDQPRKSKKTNTD